MGDRRRVRSAARRPRRPRAGLAAATAAALASLCALAAAACGSSAETTPAAAPSGQQAGPDDGALIRLAIPPDPLWDWLNDSGALAEWQQSNSVRIDASQSFDQFGAFAGGHADMVLINAMNVPNIERQSQREAVILGKYTFDRSFIGVRRFSPAETLGDLGGMQIAVYSPVESTLVWGVIADALHDLRLDINGGDFDLVVAEPTRLADLVMRGDVDACVCLPDPTVSYFSGREMKALYEGRSAAQIYAEEIAADPAQGLPMADVFVADKQWYDQHTAVAESFLALWDTALSEWQQNKAGLVDDYRHHFSVQSADDVAWLTDYITHNDWIAPSAYVSQGEAKTQADIFSRMKGAGLIAEDTAEPEIILSVSSSSTVPEPGS